MLDGLQRLEYRGYDSAGVFISEGTKQQITKVVGKVAALREALSEKEVLTSKLGMGHTRWATHG